MARQPTMEMFDLVMRKSCATGVLMSISLLSASALLCGLLLLHNDFLPGCCWTDFLCFLLF